MSAGAPNDGILFQIRAAKDQLPSDMAAAKQAVVSGTQKIVSEAKAVMEREPLRPKFAIDEAEARRNFAYVLKALQVKAQQEVLEVRVRAKFDEIGGFNPNLEARERFKGTAMAAAGGAAAATGGGGVVSGIAGITRGARGAVGAVSAMETVKQVSAQVQVISAAITGEYEAQVAAAKNMDETIRRFPVFGDEALAVHKLINEQVYDRISGEKKYLDAIKESTRAVDIQTDKLAKRAKSQKDFYDEQSKRVQAIGRGDNPLVTEEGRVSAQLARDQAEVARIRGDRRNRDEKTGKMTATGQKALDDAERRAGNTIIAVELDRAARMKTLSAETEQSRLRAVGKVDEAEGKAFEARLQKREDEARKRGQDEFEAVKEINDYERAMRRETIEQEKQARANAHTEQRARLRDLHAEDLRDIRAQVREREQADADRIREIGDINASTKEKRLRRMGLNAEADTARIVRQAELAIADAKGDAAKEKAIIASAGEDLLSVRPNQRQEAMVMSGREAMHLSWAGGDGGAGRRNDENAKKMIEYLKKIAEKDNVARAG